MKQELETQSQQKDINQIPLEGEMFNDEDNTDDIDYENNILIRYFKELKKYPPLTAEQEIELAKKKEKGDLEARNEMCTSNLRYVIFIAKKFHNKDVLLLDRIQFGNKGLLKAAEKFDYRKGYRFKTYATWWIRRDIGRGIEDTGREIRIPSYKLGEITPLFKFISSLRGKLNREPTIQEISAQLGKPEKYIKKLLDYAKTPIYPGNPDSSDERDFFDDKTADPEANTEGSVESNDLQEKIKVVIDSIKEPSEKAVLMLKYGFYNGNCYKHREISELLHISMNDIKCINSRLMTSLLKQAKRLDLQQYL